MAHFAVKMIAKKFYELLNFKYEKSLSRSLCTPTVALTVCVCSVAGSVCAMALFGLDAWKRFAN